MSAVRRGGRSAARGDAPSVPAWHAFALRVHCPGSSRLGSWRAGPVFGVGARAQQSRGRGYETDGPQLSLSRYVSPCVLNSADALPAFPAVFVLDLRFLSVLSSARAPHLHPSTASVACCACRLRPTRRLSRPLGSASRSFLFSTCAPILVSRDLRLRFLSSASLYPPPCLCSAFHSISAPPPGLACHPLRLPLFPSSLSPS